MFRVRRCLPNMANPPAAVVVAKDGSDFCFTVGPDAVERAETIRDLLNGEILIHPLATKQVRQPRDGVEL